VFFLFVFPHFGERNMFSPNLRLDASPTEDNPHRVLIDTNVRWDYSLLSEHIKRLPGVAYAFDRDGGYQIELTVAALFGPIEVTLAVFEKIDELVQTGVVTPE
jgi:hypothetical protein